MEKKKYFPIMEFLELVMPKVDPLFHIDPVEDSELPGRAAETFPESHRICVKQSIYNAACEGSYWARFVMAHELGHYILHDAENTAYAFPVPGEKIPSTVNPEKQADAFASELLAPVDLIDEPNDYLVSKHFGIPRGTAKIQMGQAEKIDRRHKCKRLSREKKNG